MITEKDWEQFERDLKAALAEDAKMSDEEWEKFREQLPEAEDTDGAPDAVVAFAVKRPSVSKKRPGAVRLPAGKGSKKSH